MNIENYKKTNEVNFVDTVSNKTTPSILVAPKKKIIVPEKNIVLLSQMSKQESEIINSIVF